MVRTEFIQAIAATVAAAAAPSPRPGGCMQNVVLPYDRPLDIKMRVLDGPDFHLMSYRGYPVWINIFATWCGPCNHEQAFVVGAAETYFARGLRVVGIDFRESDNTVRAYRKKYAIPFPLAMDENGGFVTALESGTRGKDLLFPSHLFITPSGYLDCYIQGSMTREAVRGKIDTMLAKVTTVPNPSPSPYPTVKPASQP